MTIFWCIHIYNLFIKYIFPMRPDEESRYWIYYVLREVMYMDIRWRETENELIERAKNL